MFANEYQGGTHVEVLGTQGQNPLSQWKVSGPQKGVQKVYDKALKGYVFSSTGGCRLALPRDERGSLGLTQPHLLLQLEIGVGVPFSLEVGLTDSSGTRRRVILSASFSELKCTPLHCQVPFSSLPRDTWLNLVLPLPDMAVALFRSSGSPTANSAAGGGGGAGVGLAAIGGGGTAVGSGGAAALASSWYRSLDSLQLAGTCRLRRICTLREPPQLPPDDAGAPFNQPCLPKPLDYPPGVDFQTLQLDPRSLTFVPLGHGYGYGAGPSAGGAAGAGLGVVGTSTGSSRRPGGAAAGAGAPAPAGGAYGGGVTSLTLAAAANGRGGKASGMGGGGGGDEDAPDVSPTRPYDGALVLPGLRAAGLSYLGGGGGSAGDLAGTMTHGSGSSGQSTPTARGSGNGTGSIGAGGVGYVGHHGPGAPGEHVLPSRLGRLPASGTGGSPTALAGPSGLQQPHGLIPMPGFHGPGPGLPPNGRLPPVHVNAAAAGPSGDGDGSPFGGRRALSAQTFARYGQTVDGAVGGTADGAGGGGLAAAALGGGGMVAAAGGGVGVGVARSPPWPRSVIGKRAQSGPARISTEALSQNVSQAAHKAIAEWSVGAEPLAKGLGDTVAPPDTPTSPSLAPRHARRAHHNTSNFPPTIIEHEALPPTKSGTGTPVARSPNRSPSKLRSAAVTGAAAAAAAATAAATARAGGEPGTPSLPLLRLTRADAPASREPPSPAAGGSASGTASAAAGGGNSPFSQLSSLLTVRGGLDTSLDLASQLENGACSPSILSSLNRAGSNPLQHTHRYGGAGAVATAAAAAGGGGGVSGASGGLWSDSDDGCGGGTCAGGAASTAAICEPLPGKVPKIRTRVLAGGSGSGATGRGGGTTGAGGGGGGGWGAGTTDVSGKPPAAAAAAPTARKVPVSGQENVETPIRVGRAAAVAAAAAAQNGRNSPASTPSRAAAGGAARLAPAASASPAPGSGPSGPPRQRREDSSTGSGAGARQAAASGKQPPGGGANVAVSPARQRAAAMQRGGGGAQRGPPRPGGGAAAAGLPYAERLPPLAGGGGAGRGGGGAAAGGRGNAPAPPRGSRMVHRSVTSTTATSEIDVEESIALNAAMWGGFGVDEDDDMLGSRHFRAAPSKHGHGGGGGGGGNSGSDGEAGGGDPISPDPRRVPAGGGGGGATTAWAGARGLPPVGYGGPSPPVTAAGGVRSGGTGAAWVHGPMGGGEDLPSPPQLNHLHYNAGGGPLSPPIRRSTACGGPALQHGGGGAGRGRASDEGGGGSGGGGSARHRGGGVTGREATFAGFFGRDSAIRRGSGDGDDGGGDASYNLDALLDEEALLAGHVHYLGRYDDWVRPSEGPRGPHAPGGMSFSNHPSQRAFTPPVVPASKTLGIALGGGGGASRKSMAAAAAAGEAGVQVLRVGLGAGGGVVAPASNEAMLDLVYDPVLNCYYDGKTGQYYELKT